jgi:hypothetical protein
MIRRIRLGSALALVAIAAHSLVAQVPQFKATVKMKDGSDGSTASGTMYFGGAKIRTELTKDGQNIVVLADPAAKSQYVLMPSEKMYMQMQIGQGPVSVPITGPSNPTNPCSGGSGNTDCVKGENESVNGIPTVRWDYTSAEGVRTRAWISTALRFPIKTEDDNGSSMEFSNITEGPQAASLFSIPSGFQKMDMGMMGGMAGGRGRGRGNANDPMAAAMASLPPELQARAAAAMRGQAGKAPTAPTGSAWEKGSAWVLTFTIKGTESKEVKSADGRTNGHTSWSITYEGSIPLNHGTPSVGGVAGGGPFAAIGPTWTHLAGAADLVSPAAAKLPISGSVTTELAEDKTWTGDCTIEEDGTSKTRMNGVGKSSVPITKPSIDLTAQGLWRISADLKTYDLQFGLTGPVAKEVSQFHEEIGAKCRGRQKVSVKDKTETENVSYGFPTFELKGLPLPTTVGPVTGSKTAKVRFGSRNGETDVTITWTLNPVP